MSLLDKIKHFKKRSTRQLIGVKDIKEYAIELFNGDTLLFYKIQPTNINTLPQNILAAKITNLRACSMSFKQ